MWFFSVIGVFGNTSQWIVGESKEDCFDKLSTSFINERIFTDIFRSAVKTKVILLLNLFWNAVEPAGTTRCIDTVIFQRSSFVVCICAYVTVINEGIFSDGVFDDGIASFRRFAERRPCRFSLKPCALSSHPLPCRLICSNYVERESPSRVSCRTRHNKDVFQRRQSNVQSSYFLCRLINCSVSSTPPPPPPF